MVNSSNRAFDSPEASLAALAKFPVSIQAMSSLLSSMVFLRTRAGFPFPHFGKAMLRALLRGRERKLTVTAIAQAQYIRYQSNGRLYYAKIRTQRRGAYDTVTKSLVFIGFEQQR